MKKILILLFFILILTGCYDYKELNNLAIVSGISIDYLDNKYELNFEILNDDELSQNRVYYINSSGKTLKDAFANATSKMNRIPFYSHIKVIILNETIINDKDFINYIVHNNKITNDFYIVGTSNNSSEILKFKDQKEIASESIYNLINTHNKKLDFEKYASTILDNKKKLYVPFISIKDNTFILEDKYVNK